MISEIEFDAVFKHPWHMNWGDSADKEKVSFWSERADDFAQKAHSKEARIETEQLLDLFDWSLDESVLDVGAGPGTFGIPVAMRVRAVTALDAAEPMLLRFSEQADREGVKNVVFKTGRWLEQIEIEAHDTIICMNALGMICIDPTGSPRLDLALERFNALARKRVIILIPHADLPADGPMKKALGLSSSSIQRSRIAMLYMAIVQKGALPNVRILNRPFHWRFKDLDEAIEVLSRKLNLDSLEKSELLRGHLSNRLEKAGDSYKLSYPGSQALIWWNT